MTTEPAGAASKQALRSARRLLTRKARDESGLFLAEGPQAVREALAGQFVVRVFATSEALRRHPELTAGAAVVTADQLAHVAGTESPQGIVAVCRRPVSTLAEVCAASPRLVVIGAQVRDPGNAGTMIRCADAFGADAVVMTASSVDVTNPKTVRASVGSLFHLPVVEHIEADVAVARLRESGLRVLAADGAPGARGLDEVDLTTPTAWLFGNEAWGLPDDVAALADEVVRIPMWGRAESLNLATAAAVCLYTTAAAQRSVG